MKKASGREFEELTEEIYQRLVQNCEFEKVERNVRIESQDGKRQIDILLTVETMGLSIKTMVECKDYNKKVNVKVVDEVDSKMRDVGASKAVIVSKLGFTSGAISKARRLNINLCTAHEAQNPKWNIDIDIPIILIEAKPLQIFVDCDFPESVTANFEFYRDKLLINDIDLYSLVCERWNKGQFILISDEKTKKILMDDLPQPHFIRDIDGNKIELSQLRFTIKSEITTYLGSINEIENAKLLKDITENKMTVLFDTTPIKNYKETFRRLSNNETLQFKSLSLIVGTSLKIQNVNGLLMNFKESADL
jgi:hypothetical protein